MNSRRFFARVWRVNALVILIAGMMGVAALAIVLSMLWSELTRTRHASGVMNVAGEEIDQQRVWLSNFEDIPGTSWLRATLHLQQSYEFGSGSKEASSVRNYLYFDASTQRVRWLIANHRGIIESTYSLPGADSGGRERPGRAIVYALIEKDTNGDGKLTENDLKDIAVSDPSGEGLFRVNHGVTEVHGVHLAEGGDIAIVFYERDGAFRAQRIDLAQRKVISDSELASNADALAGELGKAN